MIHTIGCTHDFFSVPIELQDEVRAAFMEWLDQWLPVATESIAGAEMVARLAFRYDDGRGAE